MDLFDVAEDERVCLNCKHFIQHYIPGGFPYLENLVPINCGVCVYARRRHRKALQKGCEHWESKTNIKEAI